MGTEFDVDVLEDNVMFVSINFVLMHYMIISIFNKII